MAKGPKWFQALPKKTQELWEQRAHFGWAYVYGLVGIDRTVFHKREFVTQWPPGDPIYVDRAEDSAHISDVPMEGHEEYLPSDRVADTGGDLKSFAVGGTLGGYTKDLGLIVTIIVLAIKLA
jgi:hypothetical protein